MAEETWRCTYLHKYSFVGTDANMIIENMFENGDVEELTCMSKKVMQPKEITVHFLEQIIEDADEDLLYEVSKMIDYSKWNDWWK